MVQTCAFQIPHKFGEEILHVSVAGPIENRHAPEAKRARFDELFAEDVPLALAVSDPLL